MGTDYFTRIRDGESNIEWVQLVGTLTITNKVAGSNDVFRLHTPDGTIPRMTLVGDHSWRYHYEVPTNAIGGKLSFKLVAKEYYTNEVSAISADDPDSAATSADAPAGGVTWLTRTNNLFTVEETVTEIPYTATLSTNNPNEVSVILDEASTHLKIEYNDEQRAFALSHASYQAFNLWTDATAGFRGNMIDGNGVSNSGVSSRKRRYDAPFDKGWTICPEEQTYWSENLDTENEGDTNYPVEKWFSVHKTYHGWTMHNGRFVRGARGDTSNNLSAALDGLGEGALAMENFSMRELPLGVDTVSFTARIAQPLQYDDFATYMDGLSCQNYAISAKIAMSREKETDTVKPKDMSPVCPSVSFVGYHRGKQGCYEFRMTRRTDTALELGLYKWVRSGSMTTNVLLTSKTYEGNLLVPTSNDEVSQKWRTAAYFLVYTLPGDPQKVKLEGHLSSSHSAVGIGVTGTESGLSASAIAWVDENPGVLAKGGSYGVGSTDCRSGFSAIRIHGIQTPPSADISTAADGKIDAGALEGHDKLEDEWDFYTSRWEVDALTYDSNGGMSGAIPSNQVIEVWLSDASSGGSGWENTGYSRVVNSFTTNMFSVSPCIPGSWKVRLQTGEDEDAGVVLDDVSITPWEGTERWGRDGSVYDFDNDWVYTKGWITAAADITLGGKTYELPPQNVVSVETADSDGYAFVFDKPGDYVFKPHSDMEVERVLLVGGGGSGGAVMGGGGGGGGVVERNFSEDPLIVPSGTALRFKVGAGGTAPTPTTNGTGAQNQPAGNSGGDTSFSSGIAGVSIPTAKGGGGGGGWSANPKSGGSGGGGANTQNGASGTSGQGYAGGKANGGTGGGGGGAGGVGQNATSSPNTSGNAGKGGDGGDGAPSDITGSVKYYGGGGGGGAGWVSTQTPGLGGAGGGGRGSEWQKKNAVAGQNGYGGGGGGGTWYGSNGPKNIGANGGSGAVILRVRTRSRICTLQPSRGKADYPMGIRSPYIDEGMSLFSYSYKDADTNCVMLVQVATNMTPGMGTSDVPGLTENLTTDGSLVWTTIARHDFKTLTDAERKSGTRTTFISARQHWIHDFMASRDVYTNVCGVIRVIVDPAVVSHVVNTKDAATHEKLIDYGKITITKAYCYNEPALDLRSWFGFNVYTSGWDDNSSGPYAYLTDWPAGLSIALNFSAKTGDNALREAQGVGLAETDPSEVQQYSQQNPFIQSASLTNANGIGTVSFRARLFDTNSPPSATPAVVTLYGGVNPSSDQTINESREWDALTNFVVTSSTYQAFEWTFPGSKNEYKAIRLEAAGARWGRSPSSQAEAWEWGDLTDRSKFGSSVVQEPINRVFIDEVSVSELIVPRLKFIDVRPFHDKLGSEEICVITNITKAEQQPLYQESWGIQCRLEPQQMADELDTDSIRVWMEVYRGTEPWGYENWKDLPREKNTSVNGKMRLLQQRFTSELQKVPDSDLVFRSYYLFPESILPPEEEPGTVYQYMVYATFLDKSGKGTVHTNVLESVDWSPPPWYRGSTVGAANASGDSSQFSAFTILDSISPQRAWINELNLCDAMNMKGLNQFIELAVPQAADLRRWSIRFTDYNRHSATLAKIGIDDGVSGITSKSGDEHGVDNTNHYTFVSICAPTATGDVKAKSDGTWKVTTTNTLVKGVFQYQYPYGIQLVRPSGIIEHEVVMQGTNVYSGVWGAGFEGTTLVEDLKRSEPDSTWFYAGEDRPTDNTSLGVFHSHGEEADPSNWSNEMVLTPGAINKFKNGTLQEIPYGYFLEPKGGNVWIYSTLLKPQMTKQTLGSRELGPNAVIVVPVGTTTNITVSITNWYQLGVCTITDDKVTDMEIPGARGSKGTYELQLNSVSNTTTVIIDAERDDVLANSWGLTDDNSYSPAVLAWLLNEYPGYGPDDLSRAIYRDLSGSLSQPLTLTEMYWLNIPPVHQSPHYGGSNIWFVAGMGSLVAGNEPDVEPSVTTLPSGSVRSNVFLTVTMMLTNTSPSAVSKRVWPPDRLNGPDYDGVGSSAWRGQSSWTGAVFIVVGALQRSDVSSNYLPLQQYTFKPDSFGGVDDPQHACQTRVMVTDPYAPNSMGDYYGWGKYRDIPVWYRWVIKPRPDDPRISTVPLVPNWAPASTP